LVDLLELEGESAEKWEGFVKLLNFNFITLQEDEEDSLYWSRNEKNGNYTEKLDYLSLAEKLLKGKRNGGGNLYGM
jgi:hypothetical protein